MFWLTHDDDFESGGGRGAGAAAFDLERDDRRRWGDAPAFALESDDEDDIVGGRPDARDGDIETVLSDGDCHPSPEVRRRRLVRGSDAKPRAAAAGTGAAGRPLLLSDDDDDDLFDDGRGRWRRRRRPRPRRRRARRR